VNRRILVFGEGTTELRGPGERWTGCGRTLLMRLLGSPPADLLTLEERTLSRFRRDLDLAGEPLVRGEDAQAGLALQIASATAHGLVLMRDNDRSARRPHGERREAIETGFERTRTQGATVPATLALAIECVEAWALADPDAWVRVFGKAPQLPANPESLWGDWRDESSNHPKRVLRRCLQEIDRATTRNVPAMLLEHASLERLAATCPLGFGRFVADLERAFPRIECIVAAGSDRAIGLDGDLPWGAGTLRDHAARLIEVTAAAPGATNAVILGRRTWDALAKHPPPLRGCLTFVVSRDSQLSLPAPARRATSLDDALIQAVASKVDKVFVLGGGELYREALEHFRCTALHYTRVDAEFPGADVTFPDFEATGAWNMAEGPTHHHDNGFDYRIERWRRFAR
jgi:dihydrofolate reductase